MRTSVIAALLALTSPFAFAQYQGPGAEAHVKTASAASKAADDTRATLEGVLIRKLGDDTYEFKDPTGIVRVEIDDEAFPPGQPLDAVSKIRIHGEVDKGFGMLEIDVKHLELL